MKTKFLSLFLLIFGFVACAPQIKAMDMNDVAAQEEITVNKLLAKVNSVKHDIQYHKDRGTPLESLIQKLKPLVSQLLIHMDDATTEDTFNNPTIKRKIFDALQLMQCTQYYGFCKNPGDLEILDLMLRLSSAHQNHIINNQLLSVYFCAGLSMEDNKSLPLITSHMISNAKVDSIFPLHKFLDGYDLYKERNDKQQLSLRKTYVKLLLENGANPNSKDDNENVSLEFTDNEEIQKLLILYGATPINKKTQVLKDKLAKEYKEWFAKYRKDNLVASLALVRKGLTEEALRKNVFSFMVPFTLDEQIQQNQRNAEKRKLTMPEHLAQFPELPDNPVASMKSALASQTRATLPKNGFYDRMLSAK